MQGSELKAQARLPKKTSCRGLWSMSRSALGFSPTLARGGEAGWFVWSPDGRRLAFDWLEDGGRSLAIQPADGTSAPQQILPHVFRPSSWSPDGCHLLGVRAGDIVVAMLDGDKPNVRPLFETSETERWPEFSPDGRWLAYGSNVSGRWEVYVRPYPGPGAAAVVSIDGGESPAWNPRGNELFFLGPRDAAGKYSMLVAEFSGGPSPPPGSGCGGLSTVEDLRFGRPMKLFEFDSSNLVFACLPIRCYDVSADGQRFYVTVRRPAPPRPPVTHIELILNWVDEMKATLGK